MSAKRVLVLPASSTVNTVLVGTCSTTVRAVGEERINTDLVGDGDHVHLLLRLLHSAGLQLRHLARSSAAE